MIDYDATLACAPRKKRKGLSPEWKLQAQAVKATRARMQFDKNLRFIAIMNEGQRTPQRAAIAKMMGLEKGPCDVLLLKKWGTCNLKIDWCEFKSEIGRLSPEQKSWFEWLFGTCINTHLIRDIDHYMKVLES